MKTITQITTLILFVVLSLKTNAQLSFTICEGTSTVLTANNSAGLTSPTYSMNPGSVTSASPNFSIIANQSITYTLYVTGTNSNMATVTNSNTVSVTVYGTSYLLTSPSNYTLGCATRSVAVVNIVNASTSPVMGGPVSYTFIPPNASTVLPAGMLTVVSNLSITVPGLWHAAVRDNSNGCTTFSPFVISLNNTPPSIGATNVSQNPMDCNTLTTTVTAQPVNGVSYVWSNLVSGTTTAINANTATPTQTVAASLTLVATDNNNLCESFQVFPIYQNLFPPNAAITGPPTFVCTNTMVLTNTSSSGIPNATFPINQPVVGYIWMGPGPANTVSLSSTYTAYISGTYTLVAKDMNNGCFDEATYNVTLGPAAAFLHTVTTGVATFVDNSANVNSNTSYFWNFGDGSTSTLQNPVHTYITSGAHLVKLKITSNTTPNCVDSIIQSVAVSGIPCVANSNFSMSPTNTAQVWNVTPAFPWNVVAAEWNWGDNSTSNTLYTSHQYSAAGMYNICLSVTVNCSGTSSTCTSYSVYRSPQAALMIEVNVKAPELISGIAEAEQLSAYSFEILPNPNAGQFTLHLHESGKSSQVLITDLTGRTVRSVAIPAGETRIEIDSSELPNGMYLIKAGEGTAVKRMVVYK